MTIPNSLFDAISFLPYREKAITMLAIKRYMESGEIMRDLTGDAFIAFHCLRGQIDRILRQREYSRRYRERKKAEKLAKQKAEEEKNKPAKPVEAEKEQKEQKPQRSETLPNAGNFDKSPTEKPRLSANIKGNRYPGFSYDFR